MRIYESFCCFSLFFVFRRRANPMVKKETRMTCDLRLDTWHKIVGQLPQATAANQPGIPWKAALPFRPFHFHAGRIWSWPMARGGQGMKNRRLSGLSQSQGLAQAHGNGVHTHATCLTNQLFAAVMIWPSPLDERTSCIASCQVSFQWRFCSRKPGIDSCLIHFPDPPNQPVTTRAQYFPWLGRVTNSQLTTPATAQSHSIRQGPLYPVRNM